MYYEDLVTKPKETLIEIYEKLNLPIDYYAIKAILRHLDTVPNIIKTNSYTSVYRGPDHNMDSWKLKMNKSILKEIETKCVDTLKYFGYIPTLNKPNR